MLRDPRDCRNSWLGRPHRLITGGRGWEAPLIAPEPCRHKSALGLVPVCVWVCVCGGGGY